MVDDVASRRTNKEKAELQISQLEATMRVGERGWEVQSAEIPRRVPTRCSKKKAGSFAERVVHFKPWAQETCLANRQVPSGPS